MQIQKLQKNFQQYPIQKLLVKSIYSKLWKYIFKRMEYNDYKELSNDIDDNPDIANQSNFQNYLKFIKIYKNKFD